MQSSAVQIYEAPVVLATYTVDELVREAAICFMYGGANAGGSNGNGKGGKK